MSQPNSEDNFFDVFAPSKEQICALAVLEHETIHDGIKTAEIHQDGVTARYDATALAVVGPVSSRFRNPFNRRVDITTIDFVVESSADHPVIALATARRYAVAEVLFEHLAVNCVSCPNRDNCDQTLSIAKTAQEFRKPPIAP